MSDGLSQSTVNCVTQDHFGFLWISTGDGLNSYDGKEFEQYYAQVEHFGTGAVNRMRHVITDPTGNLWIGSDDGLLFLNRMASNIERPFRDIAELTTMPCIPLFHYNDSLSVLAANEGIFNINLASRQYRRVNLEPHLGNMNIFTLGPNEKWMGFFPSALVCIHKHNNEIGVNTYNHVNLDLDRLNGIIKLGTDLYLVSTPDNLYRFNRKTNSLEDVSGLFEGMIHPNGGYSSLLMDRNGYLWIGTNHHGIFVFDPEFMLRHQIINYTISKDDNPTITNLRNLFEDQAGDIWFGTDGSGLGLIMKKREIFGLFNHNSDSYGKSLSLFTRCFYQDETKTLWVGTYNGGIYEWNRESGHVQRYLTEQSLAYPSGNDVYSMTPVGKDEILVGTSKGIWLFDKNNRAFSKIGFNLVGDVIEKVTSVIRINDDEFLSLMNNSIIKIKRNDRAWSFQNLHSSDTVSYRYLLKSDDKIFAFSAAGFSILDQKGMYFQPYLLNEKVMHYQINSAIMYNDSTFWLGTSLGLTKISISGRVIKTYGVREGLPNHFVYAILSDRSGFLWISTNKGLSRFDPTTGIFENFGLESGLQSFEFNSGAFYQNNEGEMFFGGINGFNYFHPDSVKKLQRNPDTFITGINVNDVPYQSDTATLAKRKLIFNYKQNTITLFFNAIDFVNPEGLSYAYYLEGHDPDWVLSGPVTLARYSRLKPGRYTFYAKAIGSFDRTDGLSAILSISIKKPFWMTWPFLFLIFSVLSFIIVFVVQFTLTRKMRARIAHLERQREISLVRRRIGADLHDDIGSGLTRLAMMADNASWTPDLKTEAKARLEGIATSTRQMIDQLRVIVWALNPEFDKLDNLIAYIRQHISEFVEEFPVSFNIIIPENVPDTSISPEFKRNVFYAIKEAVHNSLKHSGTDRIEITIDVAGGIFFAKVRDHGKGVVSESNRDHGHGLRFMRKRIEGLGGEIEIMISELEGTTVRMRIPL